MKSGDFFFPIDSNPLEFAELNVLAYAALIEKIGCCPLFIELWPGENLKTIIKALRDYETENESRRVSTKKMINIYENFYYKLTGYKIK